MLFQRRNSFADSFGFKVRYLQLSILTVVFFLITRIEFSTIAFFSILIFDIIILYLIKKFTQKTIKRRFSLWHKIKGFNPDLSNNEITDIFYKKIKKPNTDIKDFLSNCIITLLSIVVISGILGFGKAQHEIYFSELTSHKGLVILRAYGDKLICKKFDKSSKRWADSIVVVNSTLRDLPLKSIKINLPDKSLF
ncbi:hypothetical protein GWR56_12995 [Mucilaginibacter sp. 14171R-50]|uniref:hypothetical protein n=1 Tax=Mucilaginibacter sp. 14171R-50 TaxID=2703789 RepID=UPI00138D0A8C|nr:hypothetical protein [Mucilaginibacter sp. 14171R-50]QHS56410.1 hypothetical protein GWR56_12995 [Mucilaginibacter sp. 14171R-50]